MKTTYKKYPREGGGLIVSTALHRIYINDCDVLVDQTLLPVDQESFCNWFNVQLLITK